MNIDHYINDGQDPTVVEKLLLKLQDMLDSVGEDISFIAVQKKPAVTLFPASIALTDRRVFLCKSTKLGLATDFEVFPWPSIEAISFKEGIFGARVIITPTEGERVEITYIPKAQARKLYQLASKAIDSVRAGKQTGEEPASTAVPMVGPGDNELVLKLSKLKSLFERQLITQDEYENKKNELLSQL